MYLGTLHAASNRSDWGFSGELVHPEDGTAINLTGAVFAFAVRGQDDGIIRIEGGTATGQVVITGALTGLFTLDISRALLTTLNAGNYDFGLTIKLNDGKTYQELAGVLPVIDGIVSA